jgi:hypothetical protein
MEPFITFFTEQTGELYHGSFRPRIEKFFQLTHVGSYDCAVDRLKDEKLNNPQFKKVNQGYVYRVTADISNPGIVKDYYNMPDPGVDSLEKINKWVKDLLKDPRVVNSKVTIKGKTFTVAERLKYIQSAIENGWVWDFGSTDAAAVKGFINYFIYVLNAAGIKCLAYKNVVECPGKMSYIILDPKNTMKIIGRAKELPLNDTPASK